MADGINVISTLLHPAHLAVVVLDHRVDLMDALHQKAREPLSRHTAALVGLAEQYGMPCLCCSLSQDRGDSGRPDAQHCKEGHAVRFRRKTANCWNDRQFVDRMQMIDRRQLLLAGLHTETAVSLAALSGLALGYDVFLAADATASPSARAHWLALRRMVQAGVVPVTVAQVSFELAANFGHPLAADESLRRA